MGTRIRHESSRPGTAQHHRGHRLEDRHRHKQNDAPPAPHRRDRGLCRWRCRLSDHGARRAPPPQLRRVRRRRLLRVRLPRHARGPRRVCPHGRGAPRQPVPPLRPLPDRPRLVPRRLGPRHAGRMCRPADLVAPLRQVQRLQVRARRRMLQWRVQAGHVHVLGGSVPVRRHLCRLSDLQRPLRRLPQQLRQRRHLHRREVPQHWRGKLTVRRGSDFCFGRTAGPRGLPRRPFHLLVGFPVTGVHVSPDPNYVN